MWSFKVQFNAVGWTEMSVFRLNQQKQLVKPKKFQPYNSMGLWILIVLSTCLLHWTSRAEI